MKKTPLSRRCLVCGNRGPHPIRYISSTPQPGSRRKRRRRRACNCVACDAAIPVRERTYELERRRRHLASMAPDERHSAILATPLDIKYPSSPPEAEIGAYVWIELRRLKLDARMEVSTSRGRIDIMIFDQNKKPYRGIELKRTGKPKNALSSHAQQLARYRSFGFPIDIIYGAKKARAYIEHLKKHGLPREPWI